MIFKKKEAKIESYKDFWDWFQIHEKKFFKVIKEHKNIDKAFFEKIGPKLNQIKDGIFYLTGMYDDNTAELILTPDGNIKNIVFIEELIDAAPNIDRWKFTALKPESDFTNESINMDGYEFNNKNLSFYSNEHKDYPDEIDITIVHDDFNEEDSFIIQNGSFIYLDNFLGELNSVSQIDYITIVGKDEAKKELIPILKLKEFLNWRQKEFLEKYEGLRYKTENDEYQSLEAELENGNPVIAVMNSTLLKWDSKASHPWMLQIEFKYDGESTNGMPDQETYDLMDEIEEKIMEDLKDFYGYLNIGRETADGVRKVYFACIDFRDPSKIMYEIKKFYSPRIDIDYDIYKDKYWQSLNRFMN